MPYGRFNQRLELLPNDQVEVIKDTALGILEDIGFAYRHPRALEVLEEHGAMVDRRKEVARIPRSLVSECLAKAPKEYEMESSEVGSVIVGNGTIKATMCLETQLVDYRTMERRPGRTEDCVKSIVLGNELNNVSISSPFVVPSDVPLSVADVRGYRLLFTYSLKPGFSWIYSPQSAGYIIEMAKTIAGGEEELRKKKVVGYGAEPTSPLQLSNHAIGILVEMAKYGQPISASGSMSLLGGTSPTTLAGALSLHAAEVLAGIVLVHLLDPSTPVNFSTSIHVLDQRTSLCSFGAPENILASLAGIQVAKAFGLACFTNVALSDANVPDFQAGFEKAMGAALALAAGSEGIGQQGIVGADQGASWDQLVIDNEWFDYINRVLRGFDVDQDALALDVIRRVGIAGSFLRERHTLKYMRKEVWYPRLSNRKDWNGWMREGHTDMLRRSQAIVDKILREHYPPSPVIEGDLVADLIDIEKRATEDLSVAS